MKTILFCATTLFITGISMAQNTKVEGSQSTASKVSTSRGNSSLQSAGSASSDARLAMDVDPQPAVEKSKKAGAYTKNTVNSQSAATINTANSQVENGVQHARGADLAIQTGDKAPVAASVGGRQSVNTKVSANKPARAHVKSNSNVSTSTSIRPVRATTGGFINTGAGLGLK